MSSELLGVQKIKKKDDGMTRLLLKHRHLRLPAQVNTGEMPNPASRTVVGPLFGRQPPR